MFVRQCQLANVLRGLLSGVVNLGRHVLGYVTKFTEMWGFLSSSLWREVGNVQGLVARAKTWMLTSCLSPDSPSVSICSAWLPHLTWRRLPDWLWAERGMCERAPAPTSFPVAWLLPQAPVGSWQLEFWLLHKERNRTSYVYEIVLVD